MVKRDGTIDFRPPFHYVTKAPLEFGQYESSVGEQQHELYVHELDHEEAPALIGIDDDRGSVIFFFGTLLRGRENIFT